MKESLRSVFLNRQNTSILGTLGILNFRQFCEQPALLVKKNILPQDAQNSFVRN
jgi:hypothetical protein